MATRSAPPGFNGLSPYKPLRVYYRHLPHWRQEGATYFVTFRQHDSLPQSKLDALNAFRREWEATHTIRRTDCQSVLPAGRTDWQSVLQNDEREQYAKEIMRRVEGWLDQGLGSCRLKNPAMAKFLVDTMHHFDGARYELDCYVIMPNHAHVILRPFDDEKDPLEKILQSWKRRSAREINRVLGETGALWQEESFDRIIRDDEHLARAVDYTGTNAAKAGLKNDEFQRWIRPEWELLGWGFAP